MAIVMALLLAGCNRSITKDSQVVAIVGDEEVTLAELELEARERGIPIGSDPSARSGLVEELVERRLLVQQARRQKLDRTPEFVLASRRLTDLTLAQKLLADSAGDARPGQAVAAFIAANRRMFAERALHSVDYVQVPAPVSGRLAQLLLAARSVDEMENALLAAGLRGERKKELWDSGTIAPEVHAALKGVQQGRAFLARVGNQSLAGILLSSSPQPVPEAQRSALAQAMLQQAERQQALARIMTEVRPQTRIEIAPAFAPPER
jgi:EpsD family peptidyl-prolyl cis-trans isomerase